MLQGRFFDRDKDYSTLVTWWSAHKDWAPVALELLPQTGVVVTIDQVPICAGFLYTTDSAFGIFDWVVADPKSTKEQRDRALPELIELVLKLAKHKGMKSVFSTLQHPKLIERYTDAGFIVTDKAMTNLVARVN